MDETKAPGTAMRTSRDLRDVFVAMDFDGTITTRDCMEVVLARHAEGWSRVAAAARDQGLSEGESLERGIGLLRVPREQILAQFVAAADLRPGFRAFLQWVLAGGGRAAVVSAGFREAIESVWRREVLPAIPVYAADLKGDAVGGFELEFHEPLGDCRVCGRGRCKGALTRSLRREGEVVVAFGDGGRDLCMAREADLVFARGRLARLCRSEGIRARCFFDFNGVGVELAAWLHADAERPDSALRAHRRSRGAKGHAHGTC